VTYQALWGLDAYRAYQRLPEHARAEVARCVIDAQHDPYTASASYGADDGIMRTLAYGYAVLAILIDANHKAFTVVRLDYVG
jgi:hypothetical protein